MTDPGAACSVNERAIFDSSPVIEICERSVLQPKPVNFAAIARKEGSGCLCRHVEYHAVERCPLRAAQTKVCSPRAPQDTECIQLRARNDGSSRDHWRNHSENPQPCSDPLSCECLVVSGEGQLFRRFRLQATGFDDFR